MITVSDLVYDLIGMSRLSESRNLAALAKAAAAGLSVAELQIAIH